MKKLVAMLLALVMVIGLVPTVAMAAEEEPVNDNLLRIWYDEPATDWQTEALAIGNGYMGGLVFGGVENDKIHLNEKTMWNGYPGTFGNTNPVDTEEDLDKIKTTLNTIREKLDDKSENLFGFASSGGGISLTGEAMNWLNKLMGNLAGYSSPWDYTNIFLDFSKAGHTNTNVENYVRDLDLRTALATTSYDYDGVHYTREYLNSHPDNVLAIRLEADQEAKLTFDITYGKKPTAEGDTISDAGGYGGNGNKYFGQLKAVNEGGEVTVNGNGLSVTDADAVTLYLAVGTDYVMEYPDFRGEAPDEAVKARIATAVEKGYEQVKEDHVADHSELFGRLELDLGGEVPQIPTDELVDKYNNMIDGDGSNAPTESEQRALEVICYQMGRYLTIAGSRPGSLPTNLQGVWGEGGFAWGGDYHFNINVQMNYWPTMAANLDECLLPFIDYLNVLKVAGRRGAASAFGIKSEPGEENGWLVGCFSTPYMYACMGQQGNATGWNPVGSAWALLNAYEYYLYTGDVDYLRENIYPSMKEVAKFWNEALWWSDAQQRYVSGPSYSPENGPIANGVSYDQQFIWEHYNNTIHAAEVLGVDEDLIPEWKEKQSKLNPVLVGDDGQVKEWFEETHIGKAQAGNLPEGPIPGWRDSLGAGSVPHRHISHLMALYPCTLINKDNDEFMDAAMVTLDERGLDGSGWSKGHKINLWARTGDGAKTFELIQSAVGGGNSGFLHNLFSSHGSGLNYKQNPIFQIDGNFGYTAGVNEMLIQSQLGYTQFLPAMPEEWANGSVDGIMARGNFEIGMKWSDGTADQFTITSRNGGAFIGEYKNLAGYTVKDAAGNTVATKALSADKISFETTAGETYTIDFSSADPLDVQKAVAQALLDSMTDSRLATAKAALAAALAEATDADVLAAASADASRAIKFLADIDKAQAFYDKKAAEGSEVPHVVAALEALETEIATANALVANAEATGADFDAEAAALKTAMQNVDSVVAQLSMLQKKIDKAEAFYAAEAPDFDADWTAAQNALTELSEAIVEAKGLLTDAASTAADMKASMDRMDAAMAAIANLITNLSIDLQYVDGVLTMVPSDDQFTIRYTTDGNAVSLISRVYTEPVALNKDKVFVQAQLFLNDVAYGTVAVLGTNNDNIALGCDTYAPCDTWSGTPANAVDGNKGTYWMPYSYDSRMAIDLGMEYTLNGAAVYETYAMADNFSVQVSDVGLEGPWTTVFTSTKLGEKCDMDPVKARYVQFCFGDHYYFYIGEVELYAAPEVTDPADFTELNKTLAAANAALEGAYENASEEIKAEFDYWYSIAAEVAANDGSDQFTVDAANEKLAEVVAKLAAVITVTGEEDVTVDDEFVNFTVSMSNANRVATATFEIAAPEGAELEPLNGWYIIGQTAKNGKISVLMGNNAGIADAAAADVLCVKVPTNGKVGKVSVEVTKAVLSSYVGDEDEAYVTAILDDAKAEADVHYSVYDVNEDGKVDQLDITRAQRNYGDAEGSENWNPRADVNGDGQVNIADFILILNNYTE